MKKHYFIMVLCLMSVFACTSDDVLFVETENKLAVENTY